MLFSSIASATETWELTRRIKMFGSVGLEDYIISTRLNVRDCGGRSLHHIDVEAMAVLVFRCLLCRVHDCQGRKGGWRQKNEYLIQIEPNMSIPPGRSHWTTEVRVKNHGTSKCRPTQTHNLTSKPFNSILVEGKRGVRWKY